MTNKNKTTTTLVSSQHPVAGEPFEIIPTLDEPAGTAASVIETDEPTFDAADSGDEFSARTKSELIRMLQLRSGQIEDLRFQLEQATSRRRGLEKEIEVREEITTTINQDIRAAQSQLMEAATELSALNAGYNALQKAFAETDVLAKEYAAEAIRAKSEAKDRNQSIASLNDQLAASKTELADLRAYIDGRKSQWEHDQGELGNLRQQVADGDSRMNRLKAELARRTRKLDELAQQLDRSEHALAEREAEVCRLAEENRSLRETPHFDAQAQLRDYRDRVAAQSGELAGRAAEIERLRRDYEQIEAYADSLRSQLQDQAGAIQDKQVAQDQLESNLDIAEDMINHLTDQLAEARVQIDELQRDAERSSDDFERELRRVRSELGAARCTITEQESVNERLASDLVDHQGFRQALESHLEDLEKERDARVGKLTRQLREARNQNTEYERKIKIKDGVISDLMNELAGQNDALVLSSELESALKRIDGYRQDKARNRRRGENNHRTARMLVGEADGREVRFPLFRDRLTIGRTPHNDIQLNLRFISRRHAVIATDRNGTRIIDWGSRNGVYVNQKRVTERFLASGDIIMIGETRLRYEERAKR